MNSSAPCIGKCEVKVSSESRKWNCKGIAGRVVEREVRGEVGRTGDDSALSTTPLSLSMTIVSSA